MQNVPGPDMSGAMPHTDTVQNQIYLNFEIHSANISSQGSTGEWIRGGGTAL